MADEIRYILSVTFSTQPPSPSNPPSSPKARVASAGKAFAQLKLQTARDAVLQRTGRPMLSIAVKDVCICRTRG